MKLTQVKGNTFVLEGFQYIPLYRLEDGRCILLDTGLPPEQDDLDAALAENGLTPIGVLCSHAHIDHGGNNRHFQQHHKVPVALTPKEAAMCSCLLNLKCYFLMLSAGMVEREAAGLIHTPDILIPETDGPFTFQGVEFQIVQTPGHSSGHVAVITPDNVCYVGDVLLSREQLEAKLPYSLSHKMAMESREKLKSLSCDAYIMAHRGIAQRDELEELIEKNQALTLRRAAEILSLVTCPMTASEITQAVCRFHHLLTHKPRRSLRFERNIRLFLEYLVDTEQLIMETQDGTVVYRQAHQAEQPDYDETSHEFM